MKFTRFAAGLALGGLLLGGLLGGCARQRHAEPPADRPAAVSSSDDVDSLLNQVDKQLNADDQPLEDQD